MRGPAPFGPPTGWRAVKGSSAPAGLAAGRWESLVPNAGRETFRVEAGGATYFVKRYAPGTPAGRLRDFVLRRKPFRSFFWGARLAAAGFATARPLGLWLLGRGVPREAVVLTEWLEDPRRWDRYLAERWRSEPSAARAGLEEVATLLGSLHARGFDHGDLRSNIVFAGSEPKRPFLIDLDDLWRWPTRARKVRNLQRMHQVLGLSWSLGGAERELFLRAYGREAGLTARALERLGAEIFRAGGPAPS